MKMYPSFPAQSCRLLLSPWIMSFGSSWVKLYFLLAFRGKEQKPPAGGQRCTVPTTTWHQSCQANITLASGLHLHQMSASHKGDKPHHFPLPCVHATQVHFQYSLPRTSWILAVGVTILMVAVGLLQETISDRKPT